LKTNIIFRAPVYSQSGYGAHSRDIVMSLWNSQEFNISILPTGWGITSISLNSLSLKEKEALNFMSNNKFHSNSPFIFVHVGIPTEFQRVGRVNIGITAGLEADKIPLSWVKSCNNNVDLIIVPSNFVKNSFIASGVQTPIEVVEEGVDIDIFNEKEEIVEGLLDNVETSFNLLSTGQWLHGGVREDRKGIGLLIKTFLKVFEHNKNVGLILKTFTNNNSSVDYEFTKERLQEFKGTKKYPRIYLIHGNLTDKEQAGLYKHPKVKGYVSLTSGEGWGRGVAEAIACNLPVAVTSWGGQMHYLNSNYVKLIDYNLGPVSRSALMTRIFTPNMLWAYPNEKDAEKQIKDLVENPISNKKKAVEYGEIFRKLYNKSVIYEKLINIFKKYSQQLDISSSEKKIEIEKF